MPLWSDLFKSITKDTVFKPKVDATARDFPEQPCSSDKASQDDEKRVAQTPPRERRTPQTPPRERRTPQTPPRERRTPQKPPRERRTRNSSDESGYKTPPPSKQAPTLDDTIANIQKTQDQNREQKASTPKTPQTPRPPTIHLDPVGDQTPRPPTIHLDPVADQTPRPPTIHLDPVGDESQGKESFSVDWNLDNIMEKSVRSFSESLQSINASPANSSNPNPWVLVEPKNTKHKQSHSEACEDSEPAEKAKFKAQVNEIDDLWNDLLPLDESLNLADCSLAMELSLVTATNADTINKQGLGSSAAEQGNEILTDNVATDNMVLDLESEDNLLGIQDLFKQDVGSQDLFKQDVGSQDLFKQDVGSQDLSKQDVGSQDLFKQDVGSQQDVTESAAVPQQADSPHKQMGRIVALQATNEALRAELADCVPLSSIQELENMLAVKEQGLERVEQELEDSREQNKRLEVFLEEAMDQAKLLNTELEESEEQNTRLTADLAESQQQTKRLNMLNVIHMESEIGKVPPSKVDAGCSPMPRADPSCSPTLQPSSMSRECNMDQVSRDVADVGVNTSVVEEAGVQSHPHKTNITSLLARLNLEDSPLGNKSTGGDETLNTTAGAPDLSLFDLTLTTGLSANSDQVDQTLLVNHLCDIQSEAMKLQGRSEELCRENEKLQNQVEGLVKELELEKGKLKTRIKEVREEREKCKKLENQLRVNNETHAKKVEDLNRKYAGEETLKKKYLTTIKANKDIHKKKLEEVFAFHQRELEELTAKNELTEEQAKGLAKLINVEPHKEVVSTDCQTSMVFSNFVLHMSTDNKGGCVAENAEQTAMKQQLQQVEEEYLALKEHTRSLEDTYTRQNEESNTLIEITNKEKKGLEDELQQLRDVVSESEELLSEVLLSSSHELPTMPLPDETSVGDTTQQSNETINYTQLTNPPETYPLPQATRYLVGIYKTTSEQIQELERALHKRTSQHEMLVSHTSKLTAELGHKASELGVIRAQMEDEEDYRDKLLEANRTIAKLKGEILKLSTEAQNEKVNNADDELIEENEELKDKVEKLEEVKETLMKDVQILREQLEEEQDINEQATKELSEAHDTIAKLRAEQDKLEANLEESASRNTQLDDKIRSLETQLEELQQQIKKEKVATKDLIEKAENASVSRNRHDKEAEELRATTDGLRVTTDELRAELRRKAQELEDARDNHSTLQRKLTKLQPSLDSYEEENLRLKEELAAQGDKILLLQEEMSLLDRERDKLGAKVNSSLKDKLKEEKGRVSEYEHDAEERERALRKKSAELHAAKEDLANAEERIEKLESALEELKSIVNVRKKSASSQAAVSVYDVGSSCLLIDSNIDPDLQAHYDKLKAEFDRAARDLEAQKRARAELETQVHQLLAQQATKDNAALQLQQGHALALERLRTTLATEKEAAIENMRREGDETRRKQDETYRRDMERSKEKSTRQMDKLVGDMESKRKQDYAMIASKVGLDPDSLSSMLPGSTQLSDRVEALHNQAIQIRDMALAFYEASHPATKEVSVQAIVKMFSCATQSTDASPPLPDNDADSLQDFIKVFKEEHDKQTETLLQQLKSSKQPDNGPNEKDEVQRLRLSVETYTTRCAILEHNNRLLKDRNTGLENDLVATATHHNSSFLFGEDDEERPYDSHVQRAEPRNTNLRKRLAECQKEIGKMQNTIAEYQEGVEQLEIELEEERNSKRESDKRMRLAESAVIEIKNDRILAYDDKAEALGSDLTQAKESCRLLETENDKLKSANKKLKNLNISLLESNQQLKSVDAENFVLNISNKSNTLISEIDSMKALEDLRFELVSKETEVGRKSNRIGLLENEIETKSNMISAQRDELESKQKVIKLIKSEMSSQQMDIAELKAMLDVERSRSDELERRLKAGDARPRDWSNPREEAPRTQKADHSRDQCETPSSSRRVTKAYLKFLRAESARKALVFQKQYLLSLLAKARMVENAALAILEIKKDEPTRKKSRFKHAAVMVVAAVRMKNLVLKWRRVKESMEEKQRRKLVTPSTCHTSQLTDHKTLYNRHEIPQINFEPRSASPSPVNYRINSSTSLHSGYPKWDSSRPLSPPSHPRDGLSNRVYGSPSPDPSLSRLDQQLARLRHTINARNAYNAPSSPEPHALRERPRVSNGHVTDLVIPERDSGVSKPVVVEDDGSGTLSDISNYISRLEAVQTRLTDLKLSSYKIYDSNRSSSR